MMPLVLDDMVFSQTTVCISLTRCSVLGDFTISAAVMPIHHSQQPSTRQSRADYPFKNHLHLGTRMEPAATCMVLARACDQDTGLLHSHHPLSLSCPLICYSPAVASTPGPLSAPGREGATLETREEKHRACIFVYTGTCLPHQYQGGTDTLAGYTKD